MISPYNQMLCGIALGYTTKRPEIPDMRLMVGTAEHLASLPVLVYAEYLDMIPKPLQENFDRMKHEDVANQLDGVTLTTDDFMFNTFFLGSPLGGA